MTFQTAVMIINQVNRHKEPLEDTNFIHLYPPLGKVEPKICFYFCSYFKPYFIITLSKAEKAVTK